MADRAIVEHLVTEHSMDKAEAEEITDQVFAAILSTLKGGGRVRIPEVGQLIAPEKNVWVPGFHGKKVRKQRKVGLRQSGILSKSEPWDVLHRTIEEKWAPPL